MTGRSFMCALAIIVTLASVVVGEQEETGGAKVGPGKAVLAANSENGLRLSEPAIRRLGLVFQDVRKGDAQDVPAQSLVVSVDEVAVYRLRGDWFKRVEVRVLKRSAASVRLQVPGLVAGDRIVIAGAAFLRAAELDVLGAEEEEADARR